MDLLLIMPLKTPLKDLNQRIAYFAYFITHPSFQAKPQEGTTENLQPINSDEESHRLISSGAVILIINNITFLYILNIWEGICHRKTMAKNKKVLLDIWDHIVDNEGGNSDEKLSKDNESECLIFNTYSCFCFFIYCIALYFIITIKPRNRNAFGSFYSTLFRYAK
ncbi:hypothetical protein K501DRAFT_267603 [Backusella circina FSU 941]|nr:hypothetical protein K501DRAFT_267603 [Backusella circina FSU 941]